MPYSTLLKTLVPNIKQIVLPKIQYIETHSLLKKPLGRLPSYPAFGDTKTLSLPSPQDVTENEIGNISLNEKEEEEEINKDLKNVKRLDHWIYDKGLHRHVDRNFRKTLMVNTIKRVAAIRLDTCNLDLDSYIIKVAAHQLKSMKVIDPEQLSERSSKSGVGSKTYSKVSDTYLSNQFNSLSRVQSGNSGNALAAEVRTELQSLTLKKQLTERKSKLQEIMKEIGRAHV